MATQHFLVGKAYLGSRAIPDFRVIPGLEARPHHSYAYFCLRCGDIWGRLAVDGAPLTQCVCRPCSKHGDGRLSNTHEVPGEPYNFASDWPAAAIKYELLAELNYMERFYV